MQDLAKLNLQDVCISNNSLIANAIQSLNKSGLQIVLVHDDKLRFLGTVTDGDIRRGLLRGLTINDSVNLIMNTTALTVAENISKIDILGLMRSKRIHQIPVIDKDLNMNNKDIFAHHSSLNVKDEIYKYLVQGEYVEFEVQKMTTGEHEYQAINIKGIGQNDLMCETRSKNMDNVRGSEFVSPRTKRNEGRRQNN